MSKIVELSNKDGNAIYPVSVTDAVYDKNGKSITEVMTTVVHASDEDVVIPAKEQINADMLNSRPASYYLTQDELVDIETELDKTIDKFTNDVNSKISDFNTSLNKNINDTKVLESRMNTFTALEDGSTTGDAELIDIRVKADGTTADTAGNAVREQISQLSSEIADINEELNFKNNVLENVNIVQGWVRSENQGVLQDSQYYISTDFMQFSEDTVYVQIPEGARFNVCAYDLNKNFIGGGPTQSESMEVTGNRPYRYYRYSFSVNGITVPDDISKFKIFCDGTSLSKRIDTLDNYIKTRNEALMLQWSNKTYNANNTWTINTKTLSTGIVDVAYNNISVTYPDELNFIVIEFNDDESMYRNTTLNSGAKLQLERSKVAYFIMYNNITEINTDVIEDVIIYAGKETDRNLGGTTQRFTVPVNCFIPNVDDNAISLQDGISVYNDNGFIMLPDSYTDNGTPTRLIISCHGAGGTVTTNNSQVEQQATTKYLVANGYAVMDVNGLPQEYATLKGIDIRNNIGSPIAIQSYIKAYHYCIENFNLYPEVFLFGASMGGISSTNLCMNGSIPVIAHGAYCPVLDTYNEIFLKPWSNGLPKTALGIFYGLNTDENGYIYDEEKVRGYNPVNNKTIIIDELKYTDYPAPVKFWQCENDNTVPISITEEFVNAIKRMGRIAYLRKFVSGGHEPQQAGTPLTNPSGNTNFRGETVSIYPAVEEVFLWFERYR